MSLPKNAQEIVEFAALGKIKKGNLKMPVLWSKRTNDKFGYWQIIIGIVNRELKTSEIDSKDTNGDWEGAFETWQPVTQEYIERGDLPEGYVGVYWTRSGQEGGKETISKPSFVKDGKNEGRANFTTPFTQAVRDAMTQYNAKVRKGHITEDARKYIKKEGETYTLDELIKATHRGEYPWRVHVMTLHDVNKANNWRHIKYPCYVQPKINGTHFIVVAHPDLPEHQIKLGTAKTSPTMTAHMDWYSRGMENFAPQDHIFAELYPSLEKRPGLHVTGELWVKGMHLQDLAGSARREKDSKTKRTEAIKQEFHIFDVFYIDQPEMPFEERYALIEELFDEMAARLEQVQWCHMVQAYIADDRKQLDALYTSFLEEKYEGAVIRNTDSPYEVGVDKAKRSYQTLKLKPRDDEEYEISGFKEGDKGKDKGAIVWICKTDKGFEFNVTPNWKYPVRYAAFKALTKDKKYFEKHVKGQMATIESSEKSKDDIPQQPKFLQFRDNEVESAFAKFIGVDI